MGGRFRRGSPWCPGSPPGPAVCAIGEVEGAEAFLRVLEEDEGTTPLPSRLTVIRLWVEPGVREIWEATVAHLRSTVRPDLKEWEALGIVLREFWLAWDTVETRRQRRENPILERDGWRCTAPGCRSVGTEGCTSITSSSGARGVRWRTRRT